MKIIFLIQESSEEMVREAFGLGAVAYVLKGSAAKDLLVAVAALLQGKKFASRGVDRDALSRPEVAQAAPIHLSDLRNYLLIESPRTAENSV